LGRTLATTRCSPTKRTHRLDLLLIRGGPILVSMTTWAFEGAANPTVLRVHVDAELTHETIVTFPPGEPGPPLSDVLRVPGVRSLNVHRYRVRLNLMPEAARPEVELLAGEVLRAVWGAESALPVEEMPRAFEVERSSRRRVAESLAMAAGDDVLTILFGVEGVSEVVVGDGLALVRLGRLFRWNDAEARVQKVLATT
jgi:hypothetical protein